MAPITALSGTIRMQSACNPMTIGDQSECNPMAIRMQSEGHPHAIRGLSACNPRAIRMQSEGYPSQSHVSRFESQISRNQSQSVAISRNQSHSVAITCEPVDSNPSGAFLPRPRAVPGIPTVLELAPDEGRNQSQSVAISRNQENLNSHLMRDAISGTQGGPQAQSAKRARS